MTARKSPRRRKPQAPEPGPVAETPKNAVVVHRAPPPPAIAPLLFELVDALRGVAGRMIDIADAAAEAVQKRLEGRA